MAMTLLLATMRCICKPWAFAHASIARVSAEPSDIEDLTVSISYDDGNSWTNVPAKSTGNGGYKVTVQQPAGSTDGYVSLRLDATDADGSRIRQTIIRAYGLK